MTATVAPVSIATPTIATPLDADTLRKLATQPGPCITLLIPASHPGTLEGLRRAVITDLLKSAKRQLHDHKWCADSEALLVPMRDFAAAMESVGPGTAVFSAPGFFHAALAPEVPLPIAKVANHFLIAPLAESVFAPQEFHILALNRKALRLIHFNRGRCSEVPLPDSVPANEEAFELMDSSDHELRNRSTAGPGHGAMGAVVFGTTTGTESRRDKEHHFYLAVDRGLKEVVRDGLLMLAGVREEVFEYRRAVHHCRLMEGMLEGSPDHIATAQLAAEAARASVEHYHLLGEIVMGKIREMPDRGRSLEGMREVLKAAEAGRVHQLCAAEDAESLGDLHHPHSREDLVNAAIVETLRYAGEVFLLPKDRMPVASPVAAILRY